jgi:hypothetical protein
MLSELSGPTQHNGNSGNQNLRDNCVMLSTYVKVTSNTPKLSLLTSVAHNQTQLMNTVYANENAPSLHIMQIFEDASTVTINHALNAYLRKARTQYVPYSVTINGSAGWMNSFNAPPTGTMFSNAAMNIGNNPEYLIVQRMPGRYDPSGFQIYVPPLVTPLSGYGYGSAACSLPMLSYSDSLTHAYNATFPSDLNFTPTSRPQFNGANLDSVNPTWDRYRYLSQYEKIFGKRPIAIEYRDFTTQKSLETPRYGSMRLCWNTLSVAYNAPIAAGQPATTLVYSTYSPVPSATLALQPTGSTSANYSGNANREMIQKIIHAPAPNFWEFMDLGIKSRGATQLTMNYHFDNIPLNYAFLSNSSFAMPNLRHPPSLPPPVIGLPRIATKTMSGVPTMTFSSMIDRPSLSYHELMFGFSYANSGHFTEVRMLVSDNVYKQTLTNIYSVSSH